MTKLNSIVGLKCPRCSKGNLFDKPGLFQFRNILDMPEECPNCGQKFELEPGFWIGALWTSYPIIVLIELPFLILAVTAQNISFIAITFAMVFVLVLFYPLILRLGRSLWIHIFVLKKNKKSESHDKVKLE